jgi:hypothetical protein
MIGFGIVAVPDMNGNLLIFEVMNDIYNVITERFASMAHIKKQLLEYLIRECVREVIDQVSEEETVGAPAPPADGLGTADQPAMPKDEPTISPVNPNKGVLTVNPRSKKVKAEPFAFVNDAQLERELYSIGANLSGLAKVQPSMNALRMVKQSVKNPTAPAVYLFIGKDPESDTVFLMATDDLNVAKDNSADPSELGGQSFTTPTDTITGDTADNYATKMALGGSTPHTELNELKNIIKRIVREVFSE